MIDSYILSFSACFVYNATGSCQTVKQLLTAVGTLLWRIQPFPFSQWLHPVTQCIFTHSLWLFWSERVFVHVLASFWAIWCSPDLHWWEQGKTSGCGHWQTSINNPHNRASVTSLRGTYSESRQEDKQTRIESKRKKGDTVEILQMHWISLPLCVTRSSNSPK